MLIKPDLEDEEIGGKPAEAEGRVEAVHQLVVVGRLDVEPETLGVRLEARVGPSDRVVAQQHAQVGRVHAGGDPRARLRHGLVRRSGRGGGRSGGAAARGQGCPRPVRRLTCALSVSILCSIERSPARGPSG